MMDDGYKLLFVVTKHFYQKSLDIDRFEICDTRYQWLARAVPLGAA